MKKILTLSLLCCLSTFTIQASHLIGGEMSYECLSNGNIRVNLSIYRDCNCGICAEFDNPATLFLYDNDGNIEDEISVFLSGNPLTLPITTDGLCIENMPDVCVERGDYTTILNVPNTLQGYQIVYQRCCRNANIVNIINPDQTGSTYVLDIPPYTGDCDNSSPVFTNYPPIVICTNSPLIFDHSATDADGDSLVYDICEPFDGANDFDPQPAVPYPYDVVDWNSPFSATNQLGGSPPIAIDPVTGELTAFPTQVGLYVVGICVSEYRDGVLLSTNKRDFQFNVANCQVVLAQTNLLTISGNDTICLGEGVTIQGETFGANAYQWTPTIGLSDPNSLTPTITPLETLTYTLIATNTLSGCSDTSTVTIVVDNGDLELPQNMMICLGDTVLINPSILPSASLAWSPANSLSDSTITSPFAFPSETTIYTATVTTALGCTATDQMMIVVNPIDTTNIEGILTICHDNNTQITAVNSDAVSYTWSTGSTNASLTDIGVGTYTVTITNASNCSTTASATVTDQGFVASIAGDTQICEGESSVLSLDSEYVQYLWSDNSTASTISATGGSYSVTVTDANNCSATDNIIVVEHPNPEPNMVGNLSITPTINNTTLSVPQSFSTYLWSTGSSVSSILVEEAGTYTVTVSDANDCQGTTSATVIFIPTKIVLLPSAFSPNNDQINDDFGATTKNVISYQIEIFNRWGQKVFSSNSLSQRWDGSYKGIAQETGVYVYQGKVTYTDNTEEEFKGNVSLLR